MATSIYIELSLILILTIVISGIVYFLRQPMIIGYILSGVVVGPLLLNIIQSTETLVTFSQIGIAFLLFMVGLNLNPRVIKEIGKPALITGIGQVLFTTLVGFLIIKMFGFSNITSFYLSIALAFSSTIIIMKLLSDKKDVDTLYGRISIGFLIVQDFIAIIVLLIISSSSNGISVGSLALRYILAGIGGLVLLFLFAVYVLPTITRVIAKSQEFLLLFSVGWCFIISAIFYFFHFSIEAGALLAGITLSLSPYNHEISAKMKPLRDFFLIIFFILLGSQMTFTQISTNWLSIVLLSLFVLVGNPLIVMVLMSTLLKYTKRTSFLAGLTVAQISEFSLIVVALGVKVGHVSSDILSLVTAVGLITIAGSTYLIIYSDRLYSKLSKFISIFERRGRKVDEHNYHDENSYEIILFGYSRIGFDILESLKKMKRKFLVVDYNPDVIIELSKDDFHCKYGDADDLELLNDLNMSKTKMVVSTISTLDTNLLLVNKVRSQNKKIIIAVVSHRIDDAMKLYDVGATYVIMPHFLGGKHISTLIETIDLVSISSLRRK